MDKRNAKFIAGAQRVAVEALAFAGLAALAMGLVGVIAGGLAFSSGVRLSSLLIVAALPFAFPWIYAAYFQNARFLSQFSKIALITGAVQIYLVMFGLVSNVFLNIPVATSGMVLLMIDVFVLILPGIVFAKDKSLTVQKTPSRVFAKPELLRASGYGFLIGVLGLGSYLWFFARHGLDIQLLTESSASHQAAITSVVITVLFCLIVELFAYFGGNQFFKRQHLQYVGFWSVAILVAVLGAAVLYGPWVRVFGVQPIGIMDAAYAMMLAGLYAVARDLQMIRDGRTSRSD